MIVGQGTATVSAATAEVIDFVLDLRRYRQADRKIGRVGPMQRSGDTGTVRFSGRIRGLPGPSGTFDCEETSNGTLVTHREVFEFKRPWRWLAEPLLRRWLERDTVEEMVRFKPLVEGGR